MDFPNPILAFPSIIPKTMQAWPGLLENTSPSSGEHTLHSVSAVPKYLKPEYCHQLQTYTAARW